MVPHSAPSEVVFILLEITLGQAQDLCGERRCPYRAIKI